jgi:hypothetical protein
MASSENLGDDPLKSLLSGISEKISHEVSKSKEQEKTENKGTHDFAKILGSSIKQAKGLQEDDLYQLQLKEEKVKQNFLSGITELIQSDIQQIKDLDASLVSENIKKQGKPLDDFINKLGDALDGKSINDINPTQEYTEKDNEEDDFQSEEIIDDEIEESQPEDLDSADQTSEDISEIPGVSDYIGTLDQMTSDPLKKQNHITEQIQEYVEDLFTRYKTQMSTAIGLGGGGGTVAVQYAKGGTIDGTLDITGQILSGGVDISTKFGSGGGGSALEIQDEGSSLSTGVTKINFAGSGVTATEPSDDEILVTIAAVGGGSGDLTKADADTYYVNLSGDTMTGSLSTINLSASEVYTTSQILSSGTDLTSIFDINTLRTVELSGNKSGNRVTTQTLVLSGGPNINLISDDTNTISISGVTNVSQLANDSGYMTGLVVATEAQILDSAQWDSINLVEGALALASDSGFFFSRIGSTINQHAHGFGLINPTATDIGIDSKADTKHSTMDVNIIGLGTDYISDKYIFNSTLGDNSNSLPGGIKYDSTTNGIFIYKNGAWRQLLDGIKIKSDERDELEYLPEGKSYYIDVHTGDSDAADMAGTSIIQEYHTNIGAMQSSVVVSGGTF